MTRTLQNTRKVNAESTRRQRTIPASRQRAYSVEERTSRRRWGRTGNCCEGSRISWQAFVRARAMPHAVRSRTGTRSLRMTRGATGILAITIDRADDTQW